MSNDYNNGAWWGWNGGECPVHPKSEVRALAMWSTYSMKRAASEFSWGDAADRIDAFRVVKAYREPRECWTYGDYMRDTLAKAEAFRAAMDATNPGNGYLDRPITHWVEVIK